MSQFAYLGIPLNEALNWGLHPLFINFLNTHLQTELANQDHIHCPDISEMVSILKTFAPNTVATPFKDTSVDITFGVRLQEEPEGVIILDSQEPTDIHFYHYGSLEETVIPIMQQVCQICGYHLILETSTMRFVFPVAIHQENFLQYERQLGYPCPLLESD